MRPAGPNRYKGDLPPIMRPSDDPVIVALGRMHGVDFEALMGESRQLKHHLDGERDGRLPDGLPSLSIGLGNGGNYTGQVIVAFDDDRHRYQRATGKAKVNVPHGLLPETLGTALEGQSVGSVIDVPGVADWTIVSVEDDVIGGCHRLVIFPRFG